VNLKSNVIKKKEFYWINKETVTLENVTNLAQYIMIDKFDNFTVSKILDEEKEPNDPNKILW
jgi:adenylate cyclase class IV